LLFQLLFLWPNLFFCGLEFVLQIDYQFWAIGRQFLMPAWRQQ
jgi:hypothetical protein